MREILFRGKNYDGEWIEGYYVHQGKSHEIYYKDYQEFPSRFVTPETVGQYTGLIDKNGKKIFEGDVVVINTSEKGKIKKYRVEFDDGLFGIRLSANANNNTIIPLRSFDYIEIIKGEEND